VPELSFGTLGCATPVADETFRLWLLIVLAFGVAIALLVRSYRSLTPKPPIARADDTAHIERAMRPPRRQHHAFAHVVLRDLALDDPAGAFEAVTHLGAGDFLVGLWHAAQEATEELIAATGLRVEVDDVDGVGVALITRPPPARTTEAYMVAICRAPGAYFVLERGDQKAVVAEWRGGARREVATVASPTKGAFLAAVRARLAERPPPGDEGEPPSSRAGTIVIACCPYCVAPVAATDRTCARCRRKTRDVALIEHTARSYARAPRAPCTACGASRIATAVACPTCRAAQ
jgi:hypothetical protein